ncbi:MAG: hypothetical protein F6K17_05235 [Okeania sp. SIO3C4]|nr:hypothetical protein [Okeania sp. SIO3C4]
METDNLSNLSIYTITSNTGSILLERTQGKKSFPSSYLVIKIIGSKNFARRKQGSKEEGRRKKEEGRKKIMIDIR